MCGIAGFLRLSGYVNKEAFKAFFLSVATASIARGPDAMGAVVFDVGSTTVKQVRKDMRKLSTQEHTAILAWIVSSIDDETGMSLNFRGIPTTEQYGSMQLANDEIQPFFAKSISIAHNGLLSNDKALYAEHRFERLAETGDHDTDSYAFIHLTAKFGGEEALSRVEGSYALALINHATSDLFLARTFLGLYLAIAEFGPDRYLCWSSEPFEPIPATSLSRFFTWELPPYSFLHLNMTLLQHNDLSKPLRSFGHAMQARTTMISEPEANSVAVIISGGLDSTVAATIACERYKHVHLLHFLYGARAQNREIKAVEDIADHLRRRFHDQCEVFEEYIDLSYLQTLGGSTLTEHDREIALGEIGVETAHEWVPARNLVMAAMAAAYCDRHDIGSIMLGTNREESAVYADNSSEFHRALSKTLALCTQARPRIVAPLENMMKAHIYAAALKHGAPINLSWSCYQSGEQTNGLHCGVCGPCQLRRVAAQMNDAFDCIIYHTSCDPCDSTPTDVRIVLG